jgi:hypothetical protein
MLFSAKKRCVVVIIMITINFLLQGCAPTTIKAPCDNFGRYCEPKIKINQWTPENTKGY